MNPHAHRLYCFIVTVIVLAAACTTGEKRPPAAPAVKKIEYNRFKDSVMKTDTAPANSGGNVFDDRVFTPGQDSLGELLENMDTLLHRQVTLMDYLDTVRSRVKKTPGYTDEEKAAMKENMRVLDSFLAAGSVAIDTGGCTGKNCMLYAEVDKKKQLLFLYVMGELKDSFKVSTGKKGKYETPEMDMRPQGPVVTRYTSKKFPGGNYMQLGNMPYAVFLKGGYAIHGTTTGNFAKLGSRASHGCIRVHPDNAKVFNSLVKTVGLPQTWVKVADSIP